MSLPADDREGTLAPRLRRRDALGAMGAAAGAVASAATIGQALAAPAGRPDSPVKKEAKAPRPRCFVRVAAVSYAPPFHNHRASGVNLSSLRDFTALVARERPDFICYPEGCTCLAGGMKKGIEAAPELAPYAEEVGKLAREFDTAIVAPFLERSGDRVYNSVPIVNRRGELVLTYRKYYPTIGELEDGISPGKEIPVADCDGVRVGATVCFDANFDAIPMELERQRARLVFWPSMYWGGQILQHWALRYGFSVVVSYGAESAIIDMSGRYLDRRGTDTLKVRQKFQPPWAVADILINRELYHLDYNQNQFPAIREKYGPDVELEVFEPEGYFHMASRNQEIVVEDVAKEFGLETLRDYIARSAKLRDERVG